MNITKIKGGTGKPDEIRENKVKGGDNDVLYCCDKSDERGWDEDATDEEGFWFQCVKKITPYP